MKRFVRVVSSVRKRKKTTPYVTDFANDQLPKSPRERHKASSLKTKSTAIAQTQEIVPKRTKNTSGTDDLEQKHG